MTQPGSDAPTSIGALLRAGGPSFSFEFFPPRDDEGEQVLWKSISELEPLAPTFVSVTYGAGGTNRDRTIAITERIAKETSMLPMAHLTCSGHTAEELRGIARQLREAGVRNILALRGDPPTGPHTEWVQVEGGPQYASDLVRLLGDDVDLSIGVAAFPSGHVEAADLDQDSAALKAKYDAGAQFAITDMVLRAEDYFSLVERASAVGVDFPILPGIMPILNLKSMRRMVEMSGREMPPEVLDRILPLESDPAALRAEGIAIAIELCDALLKGGAPGLHFYTLNRSTATREIFAGLRLGV